MKCKILIVGIVFLIFYGCSSSIVEIGPKKEVSSYSEELFECTENNEMSISCDFGNIEFFNWDKKLIKLEVKKRVTGAWENGNLNEKLNDFKIEPIEEEGKIYFNIKYIGKDKETLNMTVDLRVYMPKYIDVLNLDLDRGSIKFHDDLKGVLNADTNTVDIEINNFVGAVNIKGDNGNVNILGGRIFKESSIVKNIGSISIKSQFDEGGDYIINTGIGNIELLVSKNSKVSFEGVGAIEENDFKEYNYPTKVKVNSSVGKISIRKY